MRDALLSSLSERRPRLFKEHVAQRIDEMLFFTKGRVL